jgi:hypothetical protein
MSVLACPECGKKPRIAVGVAGYCFAACDSCGRSTWPAPLDSGQAAVDAWNRMCLRAERGGR